jgi:hypothetical protein
MEEEIVYSEGDKEGCGFSIFSLDTFHMKDNMGVFFQDTLLY